MLFRARFNNLPPEMMSIIANNLTSQDALNLRLVSKDWAAAAAAAAFWYSVLTPTNILFLCKGSLLQHRWRNIFNHVRHLKIPAGVLNLTAGSSLECTHRILNGPAYVSGCPGDCLSQLGRFDSVEIEGLEPISVGLNILGQFLAGKLVPDKDNPQHAAFYRSQTDAALTSPDYFRIYLKALAKLSQPILSLEMHEFPIEVLSKIVGFSGRSIAQDIRPDRDEQIKVMNAFRKLGENLTQLRITMRNYVYNRPDPRLLKRLANLIGGMHKLRLIHICNGNNEPLPSFSDRFLDYQFPHLEDLILDVYMDDLGKLETFLWKHETLENLSFSLDYKTRKIRADSLLKLLADMREKLNLKRFHLGSSKLLIFPPVSEAKGRRLKGWEFRYVAPLEAGRANYLLWLSKLMSEAWNVGLYVTNQDKGREILPEIPRSILSPLAWFSD
ncbi:hypothetical protein CJF32_00009618 [Rutstroemia sp. NJR-2017a WRK4]|nr:hypothetical protein CJF32_00009618 [Rutstroemia sp. NJR-2017a WRK4]